MIMRLLSIPWRHALSLGACCLLVGTAWAQTKTYTLDDDFDEGLLVNVNHDAPNNDQLQLNEGQGGTFGFINVAASTRGTMVRVNTDTGAIIGEYRTAPESLTGAGDANRPCTFCSAADGPSRTTVDSDGSVWVTNRYENRAINNVSHGSVVKVGLIIGGTDVGGNRLAPPYDYNTCIDRDSDGFIHTSMGLGDVLGWDDTGGSDAVGGTDNSNAIGPGDATVEDAADECILLFQRLPDGENARHVSVQPDGDVWVGGYPFQQRSFYLLDNATGAALQKFDARRFGCGGYGGLVDGNGILWSASISQSAILRYNPATDTGTCIGNSQSYGTGIDPSGNILNTTFGFNSVHKFMPDGTPFAGWPKATGGGGSDRGVTTTGDGDIWVANSGGSDVSRLQNDGTFITTIATASGPTGVAVDNNGKVWATPLNGAGANAELQRIDPATNTVDLSVDLTTGAQTVAQPYNYSDMTGSQLFSGTITSGTWTVTYDGGSAGINWGTISWNEEPEGALNGGTIEVSARASDNAAALSGLPYMAVTNGVAFSKTGQFIQVRARLTPAVNGTPTAAAKTAATSPVLSDLTIMADDQPPGDDDQPICRLQSLDPGPPAGLEVYTQDTGSGIAAINVLKAKNAVVDIPAFAPGTNDPVIVVATKIDQSKAAAVAIEIFDMAQNRTKCDPVVTTLSGEIPDEYSLNQNYPNPFNPTTTIEFQVREAGHVAVKVYDTVGREVAALVNQTMEPGTYTVDWDGLDAAGVPVASGLYLYRMDAGDFVQTKQMTLLK